MNLRSRMTQRPHIQWVALLATAVVLPTVSLLWFMTRAVGNERLGVQQKLARIYQDRLAETARKANDRFEDRLSRLDAIPRSGNPYAAFRRVVLEDGAQGLVLWNADGDVIYPQPADALGSGISVDGPLAEAWRREFAQKQYAAAAELYAQFADDSNPCVVLAAEMGRSRCLARLGKLDDAIRTCERAATAAVPDTADVCTRETVENARLLLLSLLKQSPATTAPRESFRRTLAALNADVYASAGGRALLPPNQNLFVARKLLETARTLQPIENPKRIRELEQLIAAEALSLSAAESSPSPSGPYDVLFRMNVEASDEAAGAAPNVYGLRHRTGSATVLVLLSEDTVRGLLSDYPEAFTENGLAHRIVDDTGHRVAGVDAPDEKPFASASLPPGFPDWKAELYFQGGDVFEQAARRQIAVYVWTAVLVTLLVLIAGALALRAVGRQIQLNKMKNNFIATVSHELKTPLASMRVLIDTLLEGHVRDEAQARDYLQMTARENERLSRMIENFLTFSRMERNKTAFTIADANPAAIAHDAVESVRTKYTSNHCQLAIDVADPLPEIQADHDAIVTVLVNLLDNACKYTGDDKRIGLKVAPAPDSVSFAVSDNGIGLARRHFRRIFDSFYQVDNSLARKTEGCGLGLSIVKFIVDAHKGTILVESKPGKGSTFTVTLPVARRNTGDETPELS